MIKLFFATFFIAELIIATAIILKIHKYNKLVNLLNDFVSINKPELKAGMIEIKEFFKEFRTNLVEAEQIAAERKKEQTLKTTKKILKFVSLCYLQKKYRTLILGYNFGVGVYEGLKSEL